jgi:tetratricopeptide (TPR) repeat protein
MISHMTRAALLSSTRSCLLASVLVCSTTSVTLAAPASPGPSEEIDYNIKDETLSISQIEEAEALFFQGFVKFQGAKYEEAAELFQRAYTLVPHDDLLYNVARSRELLGDKSTAIQWYRAYLNTKPVDETTIIHRLKLLGGEPTPQALASDVKGGPVVLTEVAPVNVTPWLVTGLGVALAGVGVFYGLEASSFAEEARTSATKSDYRTYKSDAEGAAMIADLSFVGATLALGAGVYLLLSEDKKQGQQLNQDVEVSASRLTPLKLNVTPQGAHVGYTWRF